MKNKFVLVFIISCLAINLFSQDWLVPDEKKKLTAPFKFDAEHQKKGEELFLKTCVSCHGHPGQGDFAKLTPVPKDPASKEYQTNTDGDLFFKISEGRVIMPSFKNTLSAIDIWDVISYVRTFNKEYIQQFNEASTEKDITSNISSKIFFSEEDKKLKIKITNIDVDKSAKEGVIISVYAKRYFGWLQLDKAQKTDNNGDVSFSLPNDLPGDSIGNINLKLNITDEAGFEKTIADTIFNAGVPVLYTNLLDNRAMWNVRSKSPLWLILAYSVTVIAVWGVIFYIVWILLQIRKNGSSGI